LNFTASQKVSIAYFNESNFVVNRHPVKRKKPEKRDNDEKMYKFYQKKFG